MLSEQEAINFVKGPGGKTLLRVAASYVAPLYWIAIKESNTQTIENGTVFFLDCGKGPIAITAEHVYQQYMRRKEESRKIVCKILNEVFIPENSLIDLNPTLDIATFKIDSKIIEKSNKTILKPSRWPSSPPQKNKGVFFAGFPGKERILNVLKEPKELSFGIYSSLTIANSVSEKHISCQFTEDKIDTLGLGLPPPNYDLGGISGAPLLTLYEDPILHWSLGGVIYEANSALEILFATRSDFILPDGRLKN